MVYMCILFIGVVILNVLTKKKVCFIIHISLRCLRPDICVGGAEKASSLVQAMSVLRSGSNILP